MYCNNKLIFIIAVLEEEPTTSSALAGQGISKNETIGGEKGKYFYGLRFSHSIRVL